VASSGGVLRIGTRASPLALAQTRQVAGLLGAGGQGEVEIIEVTTSGDREGGSGSAGRSSDGGGDRSAGAGGGAADKSRWVDAIEEALLAGAIDLAVHSAKDVPGELADGLELLGAPGRAPVEDVLCVRERVGSEVEAGERGASRGEESASQWDVPRARAYASQETDDLALGAGGLDGLPPGSRVGTSSIRRTAQLLAVRQDLEIVGLVGNVDTRLRKLADPGEALDAIVLARAGLVRLGREDAAAGPDAGLDPTSFVPAPGQGALALEARAGDDRVVEAVTSILDADATACLRAERALAKALDASCHTPLGAYAKPAGCGCLQLSAWVGLPDGSAWIADELLGGFYDPDALGERIAERMLAAGAGELLRQANELAGADA
jgi:hydroxymethylbilane synthase